MIITLLTNLDTKNVQLYQPSKYIIINKYSGKNYKYIKYEKKD